MKKRILSALTAMALFISSVGTLSVTAETDSLTGSGVIWTEDFEGDTPLSSRVDVAGDGAAIEDGAAKVPSEKNLTVNSLNAAVADAPYGRIHVNFDMKAPNNGATATKAELVTNAGNKTLVSYGVWGGIRPDPTVGEPYGGAGFDGDVWYNNDFVLDFTNNKMYVTIVKKSDGTKAVNNFEHSIDLSSINTVKGLDFFGWAGTAYYDNIVIEYVTEDPSILYSEDFEGNASLSSRVDSITGSSVIENGVLKAGIEEGIVVNSKNGLVADAPYGKIRVNLDMKVKNSNLAATKATLVTDAGNYTLISYGVWGGLRPHPTDGEPYNGAGFEGDVWYNNDFVLDFENDKMYITVTRKDTGEKPLDNFEYALDLSSITAVKGIELFGWAGDAYYDNILIEYVTEDPHVHEYSEEITLAPTVDSEGIKTFTCACGDSYTEVIERLPDPNVIWAEDFEGEASLSSRVDTVNGSSVIEGGVLKAPSGGGIVVNSKDGAVEKAPYGQVRVTFDMKASNVGTAATKAELVTNAGNKTLISYGTWGCLRPNPTEGQYGTAGFDGDVWYNNDFILDFNNNRMYITVTKKDTGEKALDLYVHDIDLSGVTTIKGLDFFGWAGDAYYDNIVIKYVTEDLDLPDPNVIWEEDFEGEASLSSRVDTVNGSSVIEGGVLKAPNGGGIVVNSKDGAVEKAPYGQVRVTFDMKAPNNGAAATKAELVTNAGNKTLISYGTWGCLRPNPTEGQYGTAGFDGDVWYNNDFILDFNNNRMYITVTKKDTGEKALDLYIHSIDLSGVTTIKGLDFFGWAGDAYYDNIVIKYVAEDLDLPDPNVIWEEDFEGEASLSSRVDTVNGSSVIEGGVLKAPNGCGIVVNSKDGAVEKAPYGRIHVNFDMKAPNNGATATKAELVTNAGNKTLISYGTWGCLRPNPTEGQYGTAGFDGDVWYNNDFILDFNNNRMYVTVTKKDTGEKALDLYIHSIDLSGVTTIKGLDFFGWAGDAYYDNIVIKYVAEDLDLPEPHVHSYTEEVTVAPTHTATGVKTFTCACGDTYTEAIPANVDDHKYAEEITTEATCGADGVKTFTCECGDTYTEAIPATGVHSYVGEVTTPATHTQAGIKTYTCACGESYTEEIPALIDAHEYDEGVVTLEPTHTQAGIKTFTCICGDTYTEEIPANVDAHEYDEGVVTLEPTHTQAGIKTYTCACGDSYTEEIPANVDAHEYDEGVVTLEPTHTQAGVKTFTCICGDTYTEEIPADVDAHVWGEGVVTLEPTVDAEGVRTYTCACGQQKTEAIEKLPAPVEPVIVTIGDAEANKGSKITVPVSISKNTGLAGIILDVEFDAEALTLISVEKGAGLESLDLTIPGDLSAMPLTFLWDGLDADYSNGDIMLLTFEVANAAEAGEYTISATTRSACDQDLNDVVVNVTNGTVSVADYISGDVNGDGEVEIKDLVIIRRYITGGYGVTLSEEAADVNHDGEVEIKDLVLIRRYIAGGYGIVL